METGSEISTSVMGGRAEASNLLHSLFGGWEEDMITPLTASKIKYWTRRVDFAEIPASASPTCSPSTFLAGRFVLKQLLTHSRI